MTGSVSDFLKDTDWATATIDWFSADWSPRDYARLTRPNRETAILLKSPPDDSPDSLIGHQIGKWAEMNRHFAALGLNVPAILKEDLQGGFILMQDFGNETIADKGIQAYLQATDILITMRDHPKAMNDGLIKYEDTHVYQALRFYPEYIIHSSLRRRPQSLDSGLRQSDELVKEWFTAWKQVEESLSPCPRALTHIDYAAQNLMWNEGEIGIIDFQAACNGPFVYDIVNLLEDIRRDIPNDIKTACKERYCEGLSPEDKAAFDVWYPVITAQFYARILGQIRFLSQEKGREDLMQYYDGLFTKWENLLRLPELGPILRVIKDSHD